MDAPSGFHFSTSAELATAEGQRVVTKWQAVANRYSQRSGKPYRLHVLTCNTCGRIIIGSGIGIGAHRRKCDG